MEIANICNTHIKKNPVISTPSFTGKHCYTDKGNQYYHTNRARNIGVGTCALLTVATAIFSRKNPQYALNTMLATSPLAIMGIVSDKVRNDTNKKNADLVAKYDINEMTEIDNKIRTSKNNHPYKESYAGTTTGAIINVLLPVAFLGLLAWESGKSGKTIKETIRTLGNEMLDFASSWEELGAYVLLLPTLLGYGLDHISNSDVKNNA